MLAESVAPDWLIHGVIEKGSTVMIYGPSGAGKTFAVLDIALSVATSRFWHGHAVSGGRVLYLAGEGRRGLVRRIKAWGVANEADLGNADLFVSAATVPFDAAGGELLRQALAETAERPVLVVVDTLARHLVGDENSQKDAATFIQICDAVSQQTGAAVVVVHHSGHAAQDRARGSSSLRAAVDVELAVIPRGDGRSYQLSSTKMKDGAPLAPLDFELRTVELGERDAIGQPVTSAVPHFRGIAIPKPPGRPARVPEVVDLVRQREGATIEEMRLEWVRIGKESRRLKENLERARRGGFLRCDAGKWWPA
jgi:archaellum biogenesis ATPase FlaH